MSSLKGRTLQIEGSSRRNLKLLLEDGTDLAKILGITDVQISIKGNRIEAMLIVRRVKLDLSSFLVLTPGLPDEMAAVVVEAMEKEGEVS